MFNNRKNIHRLSPWVGIVQPSSWKSELGEGFDIKTKITKGKLNLHTSLGVSDGGEKNNTTIN